ncbi:MAG TPA: FeoB small GTPase domain-containing protein, partial [Pyrinomonadaceae bacterium]|nr:FeoB small GTPase domain-containing protein [Pyrinomonadaceae bacterium]
MSAISKTLCHCTSDPVEIDASRSLTIALAGNPNAGKTSLFNSLTGLRQKVANYPGVTVESKSGQWSLSDELPPARLIDLPGLYSLDATSLDEEIARDILLGQATKLVSPDVVVVVVDATNLVRNLYLATQLIDTKQPVVIALTMFDRAERSLLKIDTKRLSDALGVPVVPVVAKRRRGLAELSHAVLEASQRHPGRQSQTLGAVDEPLALPVSLRTGDGKEPDKNNAARRHSELIRRYAFIERVVSEAVDNHEDGRPSLSERIDRVVTHRIFGPVILLLVMLLVFQTIFSWASLPMNLIDQVFSGLAEGTRNNLPAGILTDLLADGIIAG